MAGKNVKQYIDGINQIKRADSQYVKSADYVKKTMIKLDAAVEIRNFIDRGVLEIDGRTQKYEKLDDEQYKTLVNNCKQGRTCIDEFMLGMILSMEARFGADDSKKSSHCARELFSTVYEEFSDTVDKLKSADDIYIAFFICALLSKNNERYNQGRNGKYYNQGRGRKNWRLCSSKYMAGVCMGLQGKSDSVNSIDFLTLLKRFGEKREEIKEYYKEAHSEKEGKLFFKEEDYYSWIYILRAVADVIIYNFNEEGAEFALLCEIQELYLKDYDKYLKDVNISVRNKTNKSLGKYFDEIKVSTRLKDSFFKIEKMSEIFKNNAAHDDNEDEWKKHLDRNKEKMSESEYFGIYENLCENHKIQPPCKTSARDFIYKEQAGAVKKFLKNNWNVCKFISMLGDCNVYMYGDEEIMKETDRQTELLKIDERASKFWERRGIGADFRKYIKKNEDLPLKELVYIYMNSIVRYCLSVNELVELLYERYGREEIMSRFGEYRLYVDIQRFEAVSPEIERITHLDICHTINNCGSDRTFLSEASFWEQISSLYFVVNSSMKDYMQNVVEGKICDVDAQGNIFIQIDGKIEHKPYDEYEFKNHRNYAGSGESGDCDDKGESCIGYIEEWLRISSENKFAYNPFRIYSVKKEERPINSGSRGAKNAKSPNKYWIGEARQYITDKDLYETSKQQKSETREAGEDAKKNKKKPVDKLFPIPDTLSDDVRDSVCASVTATLEKLAKIPASKTYMERLEADGVATDGSASAADELLSYLETTYIRHYLEKYGKYEEWEAVAAKG